MGRRERCAELREDLEAQVHDLSAGVKERLVPVAELGSFGLQITDRAQ
jgi:hypothetical protein